MQAKKVEALPYMSKRHKPLKTRENELSGSFLGASRETK
jgi:hypothetical protein